MPDSLPVNPAPWPQSIEGLDAHWLTLALASRDPGVEVVKAWVVDLIPGTSTKVRVGLEYNAAGKAAGLPATMIVKGGFEPHSAGMAAIHAKESRFYGHILPQVDLRTPRCFYAAQDPTGRTALVIIEDLKARGVRFCEAQIPEGFDDIAKRLQAVARLHALGWKSPKLAPGGEWDWTKSRFEGWAITYRDRYLEPKVWDHYMALPRGAATSVQFHDVEWTRRAYDLCGSIAKTIPETLLHGDLHLGNLYVDVDGQPGFFDPTATRGPWPIDVSYHICCAADLANRRAWEQDLLKIYLEALRGAGVDAPDWDTAWLHYRQFISNGLFVFLINQTEFQTESVNTAYAARFSAAALDHDLRKLIP